MDLQLFINVPIKLMDVHAFKATLQTVLLLF